MLGPHQWPDESGNDTLISRLSRQINVVEPTVNCQGHRRVIGMTARGTRHVYTSVARDVTETGAYTCAVSALPRLETQPPSGLHRAVGVRGLVNHQNPDRLFGQLGVGRPLRLARLRP
jgi:hypothetical protein